MLDPRSRHLRLDLFRPELFQWQAEGAYVDCDCTEYKGQKHRQYFIRLPTLPHLFIVMASLLNVGALPSDQPGYSFSSSAASIEASGPKQHGFYP